MELRARSHVASTPLDAAVDTEQDVERGEKDRGSRRVPQGVSEQWWWRWMPTIIAVAGAYCYTLSLIGADLESIKKLIPYVAMTFTLAVVLINTALFMGYYFGFQEGRMQLTVITCLILLMLAQDQGSDFENHGSYNSLLFLLVTIPVQTCLIPSLFLHRRFPSEFRRGLAVVLLVLAITVFLKLGYATKTYPRGLQGRSAHMAATDAEGNTVPLCPLPFGTPLLSILPHRFFNFFAGSPYCPPLSVELDVEQHPTELRVSGCPAGIRLMYQWMPVTKEWSAKDKKRFIQAQRVRESEEFKMKHVPPTGRIPHDGAYDAILLTCGDESKLVPVAKRQHLKPSGPTSPINVMILFIDAVSRKHFLRKMSKTAAALEQQTNMFQFFRYAGRGLSTGPNTIPMFTGAYDRTEEPQTPIWTKFTEAGYATSYMNNDCEDWMATYLHQTETTSLIHEYAAPFCHPTYYDPDPKQTFGNWKGPYSIASRCLFGKHVHELCIEWIDYFESLYADKPRFSLNVFLEGHEGSQEVLQDMDADLASLIERVSSTSTALFLLSDHGNHMSPNFMFTQNGKFEQLNPFLYLVLPDSLMQGGVRETLLHNEQVLIDALDIHTTLTALLESPSRPHTGLFSRISPHRSCVDKNLHSDLCWCRAPDSLLDDSQ